jgi:hypothetical protein
MARAIHDFRSDTVTLPTAEMMAAVMQARLGDAGRGDDPTVNELERLAADLTGKEDALFLPSGAMANLSAAGARSSSRKRHTSTTPKAAASRLSPALSRVRSRATTALSTRATSRRPSEAPTMLRSRRRN